MSGKRCFYSATAALLIALALPWKVVAEQRIELDMRKDVSSEGRVVLFCSRYVKQGSRNGDAFVALATREPGKPFTIDRAFGLHIRDGKMRLEKLTPKQVRAFRGAKGKPEPHTLIVAADESQYEKVREVIEKWASKDEYGYTIEVENTDMTLAIAKILGLYPPYRRVCDPIDPITYYVDLGKLNRNM